MGTQGQVDDRVKEKPEGRVEEAKRMTIDIPTGEDKKEAARQRRLDVLRAAQGLWKDRTDIPNDGVEAQEQLRAEWR